MCFQSSKDFSATELKDLPISFPGTMSAGVEAGRNIKNVTSTRTGLRTGSRRTPAGLDPEDKFWRAVCPQDAKSSGVRSFLHETATGRNVETETNDYG
jgi:hypothetical protein